MGSNGSADLSLTDKAVLYSEARPGRVAAGMYGLPAPRYGVAIHKRIGGWKLTSGVRRREELIGLVTRPETYAELDAATQRLQPYGLLPGPALDMPRMGLVLSRQGASTTFGTSGSGSGSPPRAFVSARASPPPTASPRHRAPYAGHAPATAPPVAAAVLVHGAPLSISPSPSGRSHGGASVALSLGGSVHSVASSGASITSHAPASGSVRPPHSPLAGVRLDPLAQLTVDIRIGANAGSGLSPGRAGGGAGVDAGWETGGGGGGGGDRSVATLSLSVGISDEDSVHSQRSRASLSQYPTDADADADADGDGDVDGYAGGDGQWGIVGTAGTDAGWGEGATSGGAAGQATTRCRTRHDDADTDPHEGGHPSTLFPAPAAAAAPEPTLQRRQAESWLRAINRAQAAIEHGELGKVRLVCPPHTSYGRESMLISSDPYFMLPPIYRTGPKGPTAAGRRQTGGAADKKRL